MTPDKHTNPVGEDAAPRDPAALAPEGAEQRARGLISRRALVRAGWMVPVVIGLEMLPVKAFASPGVQACSSTYVDAQGNTVHQDTCVGVG